MTCIDLEGWIDSVQAKLNERMSNRYPEAAEPVSIPYATQASPARATGVPRIEWGEAPQFEAHYHITRPCFEDGAIATSRVTLQVSLVAASLADCRALMANLIQAMLMVSAPPELQWPIKARQAARETHHDGRLSQKLELLIGVDFPVPEDPQPIGTWDPTAPAIEETVERFNTNAAGESFTQP